MPEERREKSLVYMAKDLFLSEALDDIDITISPSDREILRPLAAEVAELAARKTTGDFYCAHG